MENRVCSGCGQGFAADSLFELNGATYCGPCVETASQQAKERGQPATFSRLLTVACARCGKPIADASDTVGIGRAAHCATCAPLVKDWDYPTWLKLSLVGLLILLVVALVHGRKYFHAGREMYVGERLVKKGRYEEAVPHLNETLRFAPNSDKAVLLTAKAALLSGDYDSADRAVGGHENGHFDDASKPEFVEFKGIWDRATAAMKKAREAGALAGKDGQEAEAARLMHEAAAQYPEMHDIGLASEMLDGLAAFARKDYEQFYEDSEKVWMEDPTATSAEGLASALSCKYAVTGDASYRVRSEEMVAKARGLLTGNPEETRQLDEFNQRNNYRLKTRQIITPAEYNRKFGGAKPAN